MVAVLGMNPARYRETDSEPESGTCKENVDIITRDMFSLQICVPSPGCLQQRKRAREGDRDRELR